MLVWKEKKRPGEFKNIQLVPRTVFLEYAKIGIGQVKEGLVYGWKSSGNHSKEKRCILQPTRDVPGVLLKICKQVLLQGKKG